MAKTVFDDKGNTLTEANVPATALGGVKKVHHINETVLIRNPISYNYPLPGEVDPDKTSVTLLSAFNPMTDRTGAWFSVRLNGNDRLLFSGSVANNVSFTAHLAVEVIEYY